MRVGPEPGRRDAHHPQHLERATLDLRLGDPPLVGAQRLGEVIGDPHQRVQPGQRLLEDHRQLGAALGEHLPRRQ